MSVSPTQNRNPKHLVFAGSFTVDPEKVGFSWNLVLLWRCFRQEGKLSIYVPELGGRKEGGSHMFKLTNESLEDMEKENPACFGGVTPPRTMLLVGATATASLNLHAGDAEVTSECWVVFLWASLLPEWLFITVRIRKEIQNYVFGGGDSSLTKASLVSA